MQAGLSHDERVQPKREADGQLINTLRRFLAFTLFGLLCFVVWSMIFPWFDTIIMRLIMG